ncbi:MAG: helix-turn-helix transcriptional regulator [Bacteroidota bacterium]
MDPIFNIESITQLNQSLGQAPPKHPLISIIDFAGVDFDSLGDVSDQKFTTSLYSIVLKKLNSGSIKYGRQHLDFQNGSLFFTAPNQKVNIERPEFSECEYNWGIYFHPDLLLGTNLHAKMASYTFFDYGADEVLHLSEDEKQNLTDILKSLDKEIQRPIDKHTKKVLCSSLELILNHCERYYDRQFITREESNKHIVTTLNHYLKDYFSSDQAHLEGLPTVKQCAEVVYLSPNYLSDLLKKETGKSTQDLIHYHVLELAKNQLLNSDHSISEIAFSLGFQYPQYFGKLFKNKEGITPTEFRNMN